MISAKVKSDAEKIADKLLNRRGRDGEDSIRQDVSRLLDALGFTENIIGHNCGNGFADIYLPRHRVVIETKPRGKADNPDRPQPGYEGNETPKQQVERYTLAFMRDELDRLPLEDNELPWTGILTDGKVWHAWKFPHDDLSAPTLTLDSYTPSTPRQLIDKVESLITPDPIGKPLIHDDPVSLFSNAIEELQEIYTGLGGRERRNTETKQNLWLDMMRGSGMDLQTSDARYRLFTVHSFLVALARGVVHTLRSPDIKPDPITILRDGYTAWITETNKGRGWAHRLLDSVNEYDWRYTPGDVLRPLYESFVNKKDRKDFGEVYTPDWLAEMMVKEVLDDEWCGRAVESVLSAQHNNDKIDGLGVLDPTCGSGTFIYHCAKRILASGAMQHLKAADKSDVVCRLVSGIDIHPVAVEFSRASLLRALPVFPPRSGISIYQGDSLMLRQNESDGLFASGADEISIHSPKGDKITIPHTFSDRANFPELMRRIVESSAEGADIPPNILAAAGSEKDKVEACHKVLTKVIKDEGNSVWTWFITNVIGPDRLSRSKVDRIVANPPWLSLSGIQFKERKKAMEWFAGKTNDPNSLNIWTGGNQAANFDIAQLFICHVRQAFLKNQKTDPAAWIAKATATRGGNWRGFRAWRREVEALTLDMSATRAFGGGDARKSCVLFDVRAPLLDDATPPPPPEIRGDRCGVEGAGARRQFFVGGCSTIY